MAGTIDQLNFEVILDDKKFTAQVEKDILLAKKLNTSLTTILNTKQKLNTTNTASVLSQEKVAQAAAKTALAEQKVRTEAEKTALAHQKVKTAIENSTKSIAGGGNSLTRAWLRFSATIWSIVSVIRIFTNAIGGAIKKITDFQQANVNLSTIMQVSRREIKALTEDALMLGRTTEWTASQVTELQTALAKLGYNIPQIQNMQASILQFATAVGAKLPEAANLAGASLRMFGMHSTEMQKALEVLAASTNKTALDFEKLKVSLPYVGAIAHSIGLDIAQTASLLGVLTNAGLESSRAGTGLRQVLLELSKQNGKLQTAMGGNIKTFDDFVDGLQRMRDRGFEAGEATKLVSTRASAALLILANGVDDIRRLNKEVRDTDGLLKNIQSERLNTLHGSVLLLKSAWEGLIQTFRDSAGPMKDIVDWLTEIVRATSLATSRTNRVAQGTKDIIGSDELTKRFKDQFDRLLESGKTPEAAAEIVQKTMDDWLHGAFSDLAKQQKNGYKETGWNRLLYNTPLTHFMVAGKMDKGRAANEQVEAIENAMDNVAAYMTNRSKEEAEIAANTYLEEWKAIFDSQGEKAAREAMSKIAGFDDIKSRMEAYIANGGLEGADERGKGGTSAAQQQRELISDLQREASYLRKLSDTYAKFKEYLGSEGANAKMVEIFGKGDYSEASLEKQVKDITNALRDLGNEGADAAESIENAWEIDEASKALKQLKKDKEAADDAQKSLNKFIETIQDWENKNQELSGTGATFGVSKALATYNKALAEADKKAKTATKELIYGTSDQNARLLGMGMINNQWAKDRANAYAVLRENIVKYADDIFKEQMEGFDLSHWGDKTVGQIRAIREALQNLDVPKEIKEMLDDDTLKALEDALTALANSKLENTVKPEEFKAMKREAAYALEKVSGLAEAMAEISDTDFGDTIKGLGDIGDMAKDVLGAFKEFGGKSGGSTAAAAGWIAAIVALNAKVLELASLMEAQERREAEARRNARSTGRLQDTEAGSIFGTSGVSLMNSRITQLDRITKSMDKYRESAEQFGITTQHYGFWEKALGWMNNENWRDGKLLPDTVLTLSKLADNLGMQLYDNYGNLNATTLRAILESYEDIQEAEKSWIEQAIADSEDYAEAMADIEELMENVFGDIASSAADNIIDKWIEAGSAALDYADILDDVARKYAKMLIESAILDKVLNKEEADRIADMFVNGRADDAMAAIATDMQKLADLEPYFNQIMTAFDPYFNRSDSTDSGSLGSGIKSITEDTANLLASYINAMRADLSYIRVLQERGWENIGALAVGLPTLNEHLAQIAATNFDLAQSNQSILSELRSVIGAPGTSGMVVRVEAY